VLSGKFVNGDLYTYSSDLFVSTVTACYQLNLMQGQRVPSSKLGPGFDFDYRLDQNFVFLNILTC